MENPRKTENARIPIPLLIRFQRSLVLRNTVPCARNMGARRLHIIPVSVPSTRKTVYLRPTISRKKRLRFFLQFWVTISVRCPKSYYNCSLLTLDIQNKEYNFHTIFLGRFWVWFPALLYLSKNDVSSSDDLPVKFDISSYANKEKIERPQQH